MSAVEVTARETTAAAMAVRPLMALAAVSDCAIVGMTVAIVGRLESNCVVESSAKRLNDGLMAEIEVYLEPNSYSFALIAKNELTLRAKS